MSNFPSTIVAFREHQNLPHVSYDENDKMTVFAEDLQAIENEVGAIETTLGINPQGTYESVVARLESWEAFCSSINYYIYPVGSVYINASDSTNPASLLDMPESTWVAWGVGKALVGIDTTQTEFDTAGETGGSMTHTHALSDNAWAQIFITTAGNIYHRYKSDTTNPWTASRIADATSMSDSNSQTGNTPLRGATNSASSLMPYQVGYVWKRVS